MGELRRCIYIGLSKPIDPIWLHENVATGMMITYSQAYRSTDLDTAVVCWWSGQAHGDIMFL